MTASAPIQSWRMCCADPQRMNILTLTSSYPRFAGDPTAPFIESITRHVAARGHTIHLVLPEHRQWSRPHVENGVHFHPYRYSPRRSWTPWGYSEALEAGTRIKRRLYPLAPVVLASALRTCAAVVSRESIDLVHAHWLVPNGLLGALVSRRHGLPLVISLHGSDVAVAERSRTLGKVARASLSRSAAVTGPSRNLLDRARDLGATGRLEWIPYGADPQEFRPDAAVRQRAREQLGLELDVIAVVGIGRFIHAKGFDDLIEAIAIAHATNPGIRLVLVGDGDIRAELEAHTERLGLASVVTFTGMATREEVPSYLAAADVVAVPSVHYEGYVDGLPNVALEAMAAGKPLVATRVGGLPDVVDDEVTGLVVDERDPPALATAVVKLASNADLRHDMGERGRARIEASLNWVTVAERFEAVYEHVTEA